jgi:outer membrane protein
MRRKVGLVPVWVAATGWLLAAMMVTLCTKSRGEQAASAETVAGKTGKIGYISLKKVSDESLRKKAFEEEVKAFLKEKQAGRDAIRKEIVDLETAKALSGPEQAKKLEEKVAAKMEELRQFDNDVKREVAKRQLAFEKEMLDDIAEAVSEVAKEKGYTWVVLDEVLVYKDESADLTFQSLVKMNDKYLSSQASSQGKPEEKPEGPTPPPAVSPEAKTAAKEEPATPVGVEEEDALIADVLEKGVGERYAIKDIPTRAGAASGSITMRKEGGRVEFITQFPKDTTLEERGGVMSAPMGDKSVWRFVGKVPLSGYTFDAPDEKRPLTFLLLKEAGLVHLYGRGSVTFPDGHSEAVE